MWFLPLSTVALGWSGLLFSSACKGFGLVREEELRIREKLNEEMQNELTWLQSYVKKLEQKLNELEKSNSIYTFGYFFMKISYDIVRI
jgi:uncharacterized protein YlxW (UPF0749 family)